jgi:hypothetical protein
MTEFVDKLWKNQYEKLVEFKQKHGHCLVPRRYQEDVSLGMWAHRQRKLHAQNKMRQLDRKELLEELGFAWKAPKNAIETATANAHDKNWQTQYEKLVEFKRKNGNCLVPKAYKADASLGDWVQTQRRYHIKGIIRVHRKALLEELGFAWKAPENAPETADRHKSWQTQYEKLVEFKRKNGNCVVPYRYVEDDALGTWVARQRYCHIQNIIRLDRKALLEEIGFVWTVTNSAQWNKQYEKLAEFKRKHGERKHGNCLAPRGYQEDLALWKWVSNQRLLHRNNELPLDRKGLLDELGFVWKTGNVGARSSTTNVR